MSITVRIKDNDLGWDKIQADLLDLQKKQAETGYTQASGDNKGAMIVDIAGLMEFGGTSKISGEYKERALKKGIDFGSQTTIEIPERPFMRESFDRNRDGIKKMGYELAGKVIDGKIDSDLAYEIWGDFYKAEVQKGVISKSLNLKENSPRTIKIKGSDTPLIDSGRLIGAIETKVKDK